MHPLDDWVNGCIDGVRLGQGEEYFHLIVHGAFVDIADQIRLGAYHRHYGGVIVDTLQWLALAREYEPGPVGLELRFTFLVSAL